MDIILQVCTTYDSIFAEEYNVFSYHGYDMNNSTDWRG